MPYANDAPNVYANYAVVQQVTNPELAPLGDIGDNAHQSGGGDHTLNSTHRGKRGYPTQGQIHAWDMGGPDWLLDLYETFVRRSWRRGELYDIKYINVLNRHWNIQTIPNWNAARAGTLTARYSGDRHGHTSQENGSGDSDLIRRFLAWVLAGQKFPDEIETDMDLKDSMEPYVGFSTNVGSVLASAYSYAKKASVDAADTEVLVQSALTKLDDLAVKLNEHASTVAPDPAAFANEVAAKLRMILEN